MIRIAIFLSLLLPSAARAQSSSSSDGEDPNINAILFPANAAAASMNLVFSNPPLPILDNRPGDWKVSVQPYYFTGKMDRDEFQERGEFNGFGGGACFSKSLGDRWGVYLLLMGASMDGDRFTAGATAGATGRVITNVESSYVMAAPALARQFGRDDGRGWRWGYFFGPTITKAKTTASVLEKSGVTTTGDFDYTAEKTMPGLLLGVQGAVDWGEKFSVNPYAIMGGSFGDITPKVTKLRAGTTTSSAPLSSIAQGKKSAFGTGGPGFGINVTYKPWGLTANVTGWLVSGIPVEKAGEGVKLSQFSLSYSFGNYAK